MPLDNIHGFDSVWTLKNRNRHALQLGFIQSLCLTGNERVLDVGGSDFVEDFRYSPVHYDMIDVEKPLKGEGGHNAHPEGFTYDGCTLPFPEGSYDIVHVSFVLHHAAQNTIPLLKQIRSIATSDVIILEDLCSPAYPRKWTQRCAAHQPGGMFRDDSEWRELFDLIGFHLEQAIHIKRADDLGHLPCRALYHLKPA
jgi:SAM-dependent methyltransferase